jgi:hypothetical protein
MLSALDGEMPMLEQTASNCLFVTSSTRVETWTDIHTPPLAIIYRYYTSSAVSFRMAEWLAASRCVNRFSSSDVASRASP